jgi:hypothetical protein
LKAAPRPRKPCRNVRVGGIQRLADLIAEVDPAIQQDIRQREARAVISDE